MENKVKEMAKIIRIRTSKEDTAYLYFILESYEGLCAYSTLPHEVGDLHRDMEMVVPVSQLENFNRLLIVLKNELGGNLHELSIEETF